MRNQSSSFLSSKYHWLVLGVGIAAAVAAAFLLMSSYGSSPDDGAAEYTRRLKAMKPTGGKVEPNDMQAYAVAVRGVKQPEAVADFDPKKASFLASGRRVTCMAGDGVSEKPCGKPIPYGAEKCPFCGVVQPKEIKIAIDSDKDGIPNEVEVAWGLNPYDPSDAALDADGDGFTNLEEFLAKTKHDDPTSHPDYLDSLELAGPLETTKLPVVFKGVQPLPGGKLRYVFRNPTVKNDYGGRGKDVYANEGEEVPGTGGFVATSYEKKSEKRAIAGGNGMTRMVDVSVCTLVRASDKFKLEVVVDQQNTPIDMQANLLYRRMGERKITVSKGSEFDLNGKKYRVLDIVQTADGGQVKVKPEPLGEERVIK